MRDLTSESLPTDAVCDAVFRTLSGRDKFTVRRHTFDDRLRVQVMSHEERSWLFEEATQSRISPSILEYMKLKYSLCVGQV